MSIFLEDTVNKSKTININSLNQEIYSFSEALAYSEVAWNNITIQAMKEEYKCLNEENISNENKKKSLIEKFKEWIKKIINWIKEFILKIKNFILNIKDKVLNLKKYFKKLLEKAKENKNNTKKEDLEINKHYNNVINSNIPGTRIIKDVPIIFTQANKRQLYISFIGGKFIKDNKDEYADYESLTNYNYLDIPLDDNIKEKLLHEIDVIKDSIEDNKNDFDIEYNKARELLDSNETENITVNKLLDILDKLEIEDSAHDANLNSIEEDKKEIENMERKLNSLKNKNIESTEDLNIITKYINSRISLCRQSIIYTTKLINLENLIISKAIPLLKKCL